MGDIGLTADDGAPLSKGRRKELMLLAYLARRAPRLVSRVELASLLWDDRPAERARLSLRQALFRLRQLVPTGLEITLEHVRLDPAALTADIARFERAAVAGDYEAAAREYQGEFLPGAEAASGGEWRLWLEGERASLRRLLARTLDGLATAAVARAAWSEAVAHATRWWEEMPEDLAAHRRLTETLVLAGRGAEATARHASLMARRRADGEPPTAELEALGARLDKAARVALASPGSAGLVSPDMVGRGEAFAELNDAWHEARAGRTLIVVVEGDVGIGKTRLVGEFVRTVARSRAATLRLHARAYGHEHPADYGIARELLAPLASAPGLAGAPASALANLARLVPEVREHFTQLPAASSDECELAAAVARVLTDVSEEQPVLLVVDDLAAADDASRRLIVGILRRLGEADVGADATRPPLLSVLTIRPGALSRGDLRDSPSVRWIRLRPLDLVQTESLIASMLELRADERHALAARLCAEAGGNPFDVIEIMSALVDDGLLATDESGEWRVRFDVSVEGPTLPHSGREALARRLDRLDAPARDLLEAAARTGTPFDATIGIGHTGRDSAEVTAAIEKLLVRRLIRRTPGDHLQYELTHHLIAELTLSRLPGVDPGVVLPPERASTQQTRPRWRRWQAGLVVASAVAALALAMAVVLRDRVGPASLHVPAIMIADVRSEVRDSSSVWIAEGVARLIEARLSQSEAAEPISFERVRSAVARAGIAKDSLTPAQLLSIARGLGADLVATGRIRRADTTLLFDLEIRHVGNGRLVRRVVVEGRDALALADAATVQIWQSSGLDAEGPRLAEVTTTSAEAYRQFIRGRSAQAAGRANEQREALDAAIALDSGFGSALLERVSLARNAGDTAVVRRLTSAFDRNRSRVPLRDRLEWQASIALLKGSRASAESALVALVGRYPRDPRAYRALAALHATQGRWDEAEAVTRRELALDSSAIELGNGVCVSCLAYGRLVEYRAMQGNHSGAVAAAQRLVTLVPGTAGAWVQRAFVDASYGHFDDGVVAMKRALSLGGNDPWLGLLYGRVLVMARRFGEVDSLVSVWRSSGSAALAEQARDLAVVVALERGQAQRAIGLMDAAIAADPQSEMFSLIRAHRLGRMGEYAEAERAFEQHVHRGWKVHMSVPAAARAFAWEHALLADAIAGQGDTTRLLAIADSIETIGARSYYGRDWRLHHHVRGLVAMRGRRYTEAIREFEQARFGRPGFTRTLVELASAYLAVGKPDDAIRTLRAGYEGWPDAMARYASRSDLDRLMALSFARAGRRDSANVYSRRVRTSWAAADPEVTALLAQAPAGAR